jgi:hypothetical protein
VYILTTRPIKNHQVHVYSSIKLNSNLSVIKSKTDKPYRVILEDITTPLSYMLVDKRDPAGYFVYAEGDKLIIQVYGAANIVSSGKLSATLGDTLGAD